VVGAERKVVSESRERTFDEDIREPERLRTELARMSAELCASLRAHGRAGRTIGIKVRLDDFSTVTRARTVAQATSDVEIVDAVAQALLAEYAPTRPVRLLGVRVAGLSSRGEEAQPTGGSQTAVGEAAPATAVLAEEQLTFGV
jgi:DNA polymerase-4